jgi:uncharacterized protein (DUF488 family)
MRALVLFTVGYEASTPDGLVEKLRNAGVERVVDVRELPLSRRRGFSKTKLGERLAEAGIAYEHVRELGNPKPNRDRYKRGQVADGARRYRAHLQNGSRGALVRLVESLDGVRTCLLCVEHSHEVCHRAVIADAALELRPRLAVTHL